MVKDNFGDSSTEGWREEPQAGLNLEFSLGTGKVGEDL